MDIITTIIPTIIEYTLVPVGRQVGYLIHYKSNLESLRSQLENLDVAKERMKRDVDEVERNGKGVHTDVQKWQREADEITRKTQTILEGKTKCLYEICPNPISYHQLSRKSTKLVKKIQEVLNVKKEFPSVSYKRPIEDICSMPSEEYIAFESRISMVKEILDEFKNPHTNMIGVYGFGGVGKTTFAKEVFRKAKEEKLFNEVVIILNVKEKELEKIQKEIAEKLGMDVNESQSMEVRANYLWNKIKDDKALVILDDLLKRIDLEVMGLRCGLACNLLLTSREKHFLNSEMHAQKTFQLGLLTETEAWSLFQKMAGEVVENHHIRKVATQVAKKCGGLPILVVLVASSLRGCNLLDSWKEALKRFERFKKERLVKDILEWSYNQLETEELQPFFVLCAIGALGNYAFLLSDLLKYTFGLGLVKSVHTVEDARIAMHSLVKNLKDYGLLLDGYADDTLRLHDLVRDNVVDIASKNQHVFSRAFVELEEWPSDEKCSQISLFHCTIPKLPEVPWEFPELKMFCLVTEDKSLKVPDKFFEKMKKLRVLDLSGLHFPSLPPSLELLKNLQTLCLDHCELGNIALVGQLTNLKILSLRNSKFKELPKEIKQLTGLQLLDLTDCSELELISPNVISSLTRLEDLRIGRNSFKQWEGEDGIGGRSNASVLELKQLSQLTALEIHIPDAEILPPNLFSDKIERYTIIIGDCWQDHDIKETSSNILQLKLATRKQFDQSIQSLLKRCEHLCLDGMVGGDMFSYLLKNDGIKQLKHLHLRNNDKVTYIINSASWSNSYNAFPILESLFLENLVNLETVFCGPFKSEPFPKLRSLALRNLPKLIGFSFNGSEGNVTTRMHSHAAIGTEAEEIVLDNEIGGLAKYFMTGEVFIPNLTSLILHQFDGLRFMFTCSMAKSLVQLKYLEISKCQNMEEIVAKDDSRQENCGILDGIVAKKKEEETTPTFVFPRLKSVLFKKLPQLRNFYSGLHVSKWPLLDYLEFFECGNVEILASDFSRYEEKLDELGLRTPIKQPFFLIDKGNSFLNLKQLVLGDSTEIWNEAYGPLPADLFSNLKTISISGSGADPKAFAFLHKLHNLEELVVYRGPWNEIPFVYEGNSSGEVVHAVGALPNVKNLCFNRLDELLHLGDENSKPVGPVFPNLEILKVYRCGILRNNILSSSLISFQSLTTLDVLECRGLIYLTTYSVAKCLHQLKKLQVRKCENLVEIMANNGDDDDSGSYEIAFSQLNHLELSDLPSLQGFCTRNCIVKLPSLDKDTLIVKDCCIELSISPDGLLLSDSKPQRLQITEEEQEGTKGC